MEDPTCPPTPPLSKCPDTPPRAGSSKSSPSKWAPDLKEKSQSPTPNRPSSPENCAICLGPLTNKSFTNSCCHQFCFVCLLEWSKVKAECPLCKVAFDSIIHNVRSQDDYDQYHVVRQAPTLPTALSSVVLLSNSRATIQYQYRAFSEWMANHGLNRFVLHDSIPPGPRIRSPSRGTPVGTSAFRRSIYDRDLWARLQPDVTGRYRDCSPEFYAQNPAQLHRLVPFLNRELNVLLEGNNTRSMYVMDKILELLPVCSMTSTMFRSQVARLIGHLNAPHFCHELRVFASSPYDLPGYDRSVQYHPNGGAGVSIELEDSDSEHGGGSGYDDDDIQIIDSNSQPSMSRNLPSASASASASTPVPSGSSESSSRPTRHPSVVNVPSESDSDGNEDIQVVGYVKPRHERTPEVITLSSPEHQGSSSHRAIADVRVSAPSSPDELVCINLGRSSSAVHTWHDNEVLSDSSQEFSHQHRLRRRPKVSEVLHFEPVSSESLQSFSSSSGDEWKGTCSKRKYRLKAVKHRHKSHKQKKNNIVVSSSEGESQPSTSRGKFRTKVSNSKTIAVTTREDTSMARSNGVSSCSEEESLQSTSREKSRRNVKGCRNKSSPSTSRVEASYTRSDSDSECDLPKTSLRSAIIPSCSKSHYSSHSSSEEEVLESEKKVRNLTVRRTISDEGHDSWKVEDSKSIFKNYSYCSSKGMHHKSSHSSKSSSGGTPSHRRHRSTSHRSKHRTSHDSETSPSKRKRSHSRKSSSSSKSCKRKKERLCTPDSCSGSPRKKSASPKFSLSSVFKS